MVRKLAAEGADVVVMTTAAGNGVGAGRRADREGRRARAGGDPGRRCAASTRLFVLNPVASDELVRALTSRCASRRDAKVKGIVYFSMVNADKLVDVPHAAAKFAGERMIETLDLPATVLRPNFFFPNGVIKEMLMDKGVYIMPIGNKGGAIVDIGDIAEVAALELLRRDRAEGPLPRDLIDISGPEVLTGGRHRRHLVGRAGQENHLRGATTSQRSRSRRGRTCRPRWPTTSR